MAHSMQISSLLLLVKSQIRLEALKHSLNVAEWLCVHAATRCEQAVNIEGGGAGHSGFYFFFQCTAQAIVSFGPRLSPLLVN